MILLNICDDELVFYAFSLLLNLVHTISNELEKYRYNL